MPFFFLFFFLSGIWGWARVNEEKSNAGCFLLRSLHLATVAPASVAAPRRVASKWSRMSPLTYPRGRCSWWNIPRGGDGGGGAVRGRRGRSGVAEEGRIVARRFAAPKFRVPSLPVTLGHDGVITTKNEAEQDFNDDQYESFPTQDYPLLSSACLAKKIIGNTTPETPTPRTQRR